MTTPCDDAAGHSHLTHHLPKASLLFLFFCIILSIFSISCHHVAATSQQQNHLHQHHLNTIYLPTKSIPKTLKFYRDLWGMELNPQREVDHQHHVASQLKRILELQPRSAAAVQLEKAMNSESPSDSTTSSTHLQETAEDHHAEYYYYRDLEVPPGASVSAFRIKMIPAWILPSAQQQRSGNGESLQPLHRITFSVSCRENIHEMITHLQKLRIPILEGPIANAHQEIQVKIKDPSGNFIWLVVFPHQTLEGEEAEAVRANRQGRHDEL